MALLFNIRMFTYLHKNVCAVCNAGNMYFNFQSTFLSFEYINNQLTAQLDKVELHCVLAIIRDLLHGKV